MSLNNYAKFVLKNRQYYRFKNVGYYPEELKPYVTDRILYWASSFLSSAYIMRIYDRKPHWRSRLFKDIERANFLIRLARPDNVNKVINVARKHFEKSNTRAFNLLLKNVYVGSLLGNLKKLPNGKVIPKRRFFYYLAIRFRKARIEINGRKVLVYVALVERMCPWGQVVHNTITKETEKQILKGQIFQPRLGKRK